MTDARDANDTNAAVDEHHVRVVRAGHGANCSSIGSVIDTLFATAVVGSAVLAAVLAAMRSESVRVVGNGTGAGAGAQSEADRGDGTSPVGGGGELGVGANPPLCVRLGAPEDER